MPTVQRRTPLRQPGPLSDATSQQTVAATLPYTGHPALPHAPAEDLLQGVGRGEVPRGAYRLFPEREDGGLQGPHPITINVSQLKVNQDGKEKRRKRRADSP